MATSASEWKKKSARELELPSGNTALVKRPGLSSLLSQGLLPDSLMPKIMEQMNSAQGGQPTEEKIKESGLMETPGQMNDMFDAFDRVASASCVEPVLLYYKRKTGKDDSGNDVWEIIPNPERDTEVLYSDDIDLDDKMFIFNYAVGGDDDLESFRKQSKPSVVAVPALESVPLPPVPASRD